MAVNLTPRPHGRSQTMPNLVNPGLETISEASHSCFICAQVGSQMLAEITKDGYNRYICADACLKRYITEFLSKDEKFVTIKRSADAKKTESQRPRLAVTLPDAPTELGNKVIRHQKTPYVKSSGED